MDVKRIHQLFESDLVVINMGVESFGENLKDQGVRTLQMSWRPPAGGDTELIGLLDRLDTDETREAIDRANQEAVARILAARPVLRDIASAGESIPGMEKNMILHSGPPVSWERMCGPVRGAVIGGLILEGLAENREEAERVAASGEITFHPCHHHQAVGPMAGVITWSMPVWVVENAAFGNYAFSNFNEGLGKVLRYGAFDDTVIDRLRWIGSELAPRLKEALDRHGPFDLKSLIAQALQMGDECHNRNRAATSLFIREMAPHLAGLRAPGESISKIFSFLNDNDHFFLNLSMAAAKCTVDPARDIESSSLVTAMARNGTDFGIRIAGLGDRWFTAPAPMVEGLYLPGFSAENAAPDLGDSVITETAGWGGFAMAAAPAIVKFVGGTPADAVRYTRMMYEITVTENDRFQIPFLDFRGTPTGIDLLKVMAADIYPIINTGIAHKEPGVGMVGAGLVRPPQQCFADALRAFAERSG